MGGQVKQVTDNTSLDAWNQHAAMTIILTDELAVKVRTYDVLSLLASGKKNPLMGIANKLTGVKDAEAAGNALMDDPESVAQLTETLNKMLIEVVVSPPLKEQGHEEGISVNQFTLEWKMMVFNALIGGHAVNRAETFPK